MAARKRKRVTASLDRRLYRDLEFAARVQGVTLSAKVRLLLRDALDAEEDAYFAKVAGERMATRDDTKALTHEQVWGTDET